MKEEQALNFLKDEYLHLQNTIEHFDGRALTIKAWSITFSLGAIVTASIYHAPALLLVGGFSAILFWVIEGYWKAFQYAYYERLGQIEDYFAGVSTKAPLPLQMGRCWFAKWKKDGLRRRWLIVRWPHVALPHAAVFILGIFWYLLIKLGIATI